MINYIGQDGRVHYLGENELMHYNHNHDKLGRFASSGGSARSIQRGLRKLEKHRVETLGREMKANYKFRKAYAKADKKLNKAAKAAMSSDKKKADRLKESAFSSMTKSSKKQKKYETYVNNRKDTEAFINKAIANANKNGYTVSSKAGTRSSQRGKDFLDIYLQAETAGFIGIVAGQSRKRQNYQKKYGQYYSNQTPSRIEYKKYNVKPTYKKTPRKYRGYKEDYITVADVKTGKVTTYDNRKKKRT